MERLTDRFDDGKVGVVGIFDKKELIEVSEHIEDAIVNASVQEALDKLAEYEDTGLTPEEINKLKENYGYWRSEAQKWCSQLGEAKFHEGQGLITRYKCKIGDMVYEVNKNTNTVSGYIITEINTYEYGHKNVFYKWEIIEGISSGAKGFNEKELGKTVFLTKEEAEALKGGENYVGDSN